MFRLPPSSPSSFAPFYPSDVADHKYLDREGPKVRANLHTFMSSTFAPVDRSVIRDIIDNVSFSKEARGSLDLSSLSPWARMMRDIVSDADKIEALGEVGLSRCFEYSRETDPLGSEEHHWRHVALHCDEKLLRLRDEYIRTEGGRRMSEEGHEFLRKWRDEVGVKYVEI